MIKISNTAKEPRHLILHRIVLLAIGLMAVFYFRSLGLVAYVVVTIIYCRILANMKGVEFIWFGARESSPGNLYASFLIGGFCLSLIGALLSYSYTDQFAVIATSWDNMDIVEFKPQCLKSERFYKHGFFNCDTFYWWISSLSLIFPLVVALALTDMVKVAQLRIRIGKWIFLIIILSIILLTVPFILSLALTGSHYGYMLKITLLSLPLLILPFLLNRFAF